MLIDNTNIIVISDLHLGDKSLYDLFVGEDQLITLLEEYNNKPIHLVINGDFIDFLSIEPFEGNSLYAALLKLNNVFSKYTLLFDKLRDFLITDSHYLTIIIGNHDIELIHADIRDAIIKRLSGTSANVVFLIEKPLIIHFRNGLLHVEHGNQYDSLNRYDFKNIFLNDEMKAINFCLGSKLVKDVINHHLHKYPFLNKLQPHILVLLIMWLVNKEALADFILEFSFTKTKDRLKDQFHKTARRVRSMKDFCSIVENKIRKCFGKEVLSLRTNGAKNSSNNDVEILSTIIAEQFVGERRMSDELDMASLVYFLQSGHFPWDSSSDVLSPQKRKYLHAVRNWLNSPFLGMLVKRASKIEETTISYDHACVTGAAEVLNAYPDIEGIKIIIFGHTHNKLRCEISDNNYYINCGSWARTAKFKKCPDLSNYDELQQWLTDIESGEAFSFDSEPSWVEVNIRDNMIDKFDIKT